MRARVRRLLGGRRSLRRRVAMLALVGGLVLAGQLVAQLISGQGAQNSSNLGTRIDVARTDLALLGTAVDAQRSNLLLYRAGGAYHYATSYAAEVTRGRSLLERLRGDVTGATDEASVAELATAVAAWESWAGQEMDGSGPLAVADLATGDARYGAVRAVQQALADELAARFAAAQNGAEQAGLVAFATSIAGSLAAAAVLIVLAVRIVRLGVVPVVRLAATARSIALGEPATIEPAGSDEVRDLALALEAWQQAAAERAVVVDQAPTGIVRLDPAGRIVSVNRAIETFHRVPAGRLTGRMVFEVIHPADRWRVEEVVRELADGRRTSATLEARALRADGSTVWCSITAGRLLSADRRTVGTIGVVEDISERKQQSERAARIQRELWPARAPALDGYDVAGACLPALEVAGDLYDWELGEDGQLDLTVADVMGKGIGAALVAAMLRTALRVAPGGFGPAAKLSLASRSMPLGRSDDETFVTVFHARLDTRTGLLRYVDAGHGYCHVLRRSGETFRLPVRSLPLGIRPEEDFAEGSLRLEEGDTLVVYSDGLVEQPGVPAMDSALGGVRDAGDAAGVVHQLLGRMPAHLADDVTALAVRRTARGHVSAVA